MLALSKKNWVNSFFFLLCKRHWNCSWWCFFHSAFPRFERNSQSWTCWHVWSSCNWWLWLPPLLCSFKAICWNGRGAGSTDLWWWITCLLKVVTRGHSKNKYLCSSLKQPFSVWVKKVIWFLSPSLYNFIFFFCFVLFKRESTSSCLFIKRGKKPTKLSYEIDFILPFNFMLSVPVLPLFRT